MVSTETARRLREKYRGADSGVPATSRPTSDDISQRLRRLEQRLEALDRRTAMISSSFWLRAFAAWGHMAVAGLVIYLLVLALAIALRLRGYLPG